MIKVHRLATVAAAVWMLLLGVGCDSTEEELLLDPDEVAAFSLASADFTDESIGKLDIALWKEIDATGDNTMELDLSRPIHMHYFVANLHHEGYTPETEPGLYGMLAAIRRGEIVRASSLSGVAPTCNASGLQNLQQSTSNQTTSSLSVSLSALGNCPNTSSYVQAKVYKYPLSSPNSTVTLLSSNAKTGSGVALETDKVATTSTKSDGIKISSLAYFYNDAGAVYYAPVQVNSATRIGLLNLSGRKGSTPSLSAQRVELTPNEKSLQGSTTLPVWPQDSDLNGSILGCLDRTYGYDQNSSCDFCTLKGAACSVSSSTLAAGYPYIPVLGSYSYVAPTQTEPPFDSVRIGTELSYLTTMVNCTTSASTVSLNICLRDQPVATWGCAADFSTSYTSKFPRCSTIPSTSRKSYARLNCATGVAGDTVFDFDAPYFEATDTYPQLVFGPYTQCYYQESKDLRFSVTGALYKSGNAVPNSSSVYTFGDASQPCEEEGLPCSSKKFQFAIGCLTPDTRITLEGDGLERPIQDFDRANEHAYVMGESSGALRMVTGFIRGYDQLIVVVTESGGRTISSSVTHPFKTPGGFIKAIDLQVGDPLEMIDGVSTVTQVELRTYDGPTYSLNVSDTNAQPLSSENRTYFANGFRVGDFEVQNALEEVGVGPQSHAADWRKTFLKWRANHRR